MMETIDENSGKERKKVAYVKHPITPKQKAAILTKFDKILDAKFNPDEPGVATVGFKKEKAEDDEPSKEEWDDLKARAEKLDITVQANIKFDTLLKKVEAAEKKQA